MELCHVLIPCYTFFVFASIESAVFYGLGKIEYLALGSFLANLFQISLFLCMTYGILSQDLLVVAGILGSSIIVGSVIRTVMYAFLIKKHSLL